MLFGFVPMALVSKIAWKCLLELASIANVSKQFEKLEMADVKSTFLMI